MRALGITALVVELRHSDHLRREAFAMSLYICIVLLSALSVLGGTTPSQGTIFLLILGTTVGLVLAHGFAGWVAAVIVGDDVEVGSGIDVPSASKVLSVQLAGAGVVSAVALTAAALAATENELVVVRLTVAATIAALVLNESRRRNSLARAALHGLIALVGAIVVAWAKSALVH